MCRSGASRYQRMLPTEPWERVRVGSSCAAASAECRSHCHIDVESLSCVFIPQSLTALLSWPSFLQPAGNNAACTTLISTFSPRRREPVRLGREGGARVSPLCCLRPTSYVYLAYVAVSRKERLKCHIFGTLADISNSSDPGTATRQARCAMIRTAMARLV